MHENIVTKIPHSLYQHVTWVAFQQIFAVVGDNVAHMVWHFKKHPTLTMVKGKQCILNNIFTDDIFILQNIQTVKSAFILVDNKWKHSFRILCSYEDMILTIRASVKLTYGVNYILKSPWYAKNQDQMLFFQF